MSALLLIIILSALSIAYGIWAYGDVMKRDAGNQRIRKVFAGDILPLAKCRADKSLPPPPD